MSTRGKIKIALLLWESNPKPLQRLLLVYVVDFDVVQSFPILCCIIDRGLNNSGYPAQRHLVVANNLV